MKLQGKIITHSLALYTASAAFILLGLGSARATDYPTTILADKPSAYYRFEELPGATIAADSSTNDMPATYYYNAEDTSPQLGLPGIDTNSIAFNGGGSSGDFGYVDIPASPLICPINNTASGPFSAELWVNVPNQPVTWQVPICVAQYPNGWNIYVSGADAGNGAASYFYLDMRPSIFTGVAKITFLQWNHVVLTFDGTNAIMYVNGVEYGPYNGTGFVPTPSSDGLIGSGATVGWQPLNGGVDEVAFYTNVLSEAQVLEHYTVGTNSFRAPPTPPTIITGGNPASTTNYSGLPVAFTVAATGSFPLSYQWFENSTSIGSNSSSLNFTCQYPADSGANIQVVITNNYGSVTSVVASLTVLTNDNIAGSPGSITRNVGSHAAFHVTAFGAVPIDYQWSQSIDGGSTFSTIAGATNATYWLTNVQMSQNGYQYGVNVIGPFGTTAASPATLDVQPRAVNVPLTGYGAIVAADNPVAYWRFDETAGSATAVDAVGSFDGAYTPAAGTITYGVAPGISNDTDTAVGIVNGATIQIPFAPEINPDTTWSIESWVDPTSLGANGGDYRVVLSSEYNLYPNPYNGWYLYQQPNNTFAFVPQPGNAFLTGGSIAANNWYHLVVTDDGTNFNFYINGVLAVAPLPLASANFIANGDGINNDGTAGITSGLGNTVLGERTDGSFNTFEGNIDDTAIYNYALSPQQIQNHFLNTTRIAIAISGGNIVLTWPVGTLKSATNANGPYSTVVGATSPYLVPSGGSQMFFRVEVQ